MIGSVFIVSAARSGSTLLDRLVGMHPDALAAGELRQLPKNIALDSRCSCGAPVSGCGFWRPVVDACSRELGVDLWREPYKLDLGYIQAGVEIDRTRQTRLYLWRRALAMRQVDWALRAGADAGRSPWLASFRRGLRNNAMLHEVLRRQSGRRVIVDSTKGFRWSVGQCLLDPVASRVLVLTRDGRGVMASMMRSGRTPEQAARSWAEYYERALPFVTRHVPEAQRMHLRYEDLAGDTARTLRRLFAFLGLPDRGVAPAPAGPAHVEHILNGNPMRERPLSVIRLDESWRKELSSTHLAVFERHAAHMARQLGYSVSAETQP